MLYACPATASQEAREVPPPPESSSLARCWRPASVSPSYTPSVVSKLLPIVSTVTSPVCGAVHEYQIDAPPGFPAWYGSSYSQPAPTVDPETEPSLPEMLWAFANRSFGGGGGSSCQLRTTVPVAPPPSPSTRIQ